MICNTYLQHWDEIFDHGFFGTLKELSIPVQDMTQTITTERVQLAQRDLLIDAYLAQPAAAGQFPGVIVLQEIFGVNDHIRDVTNRIAQLGYVAIAPALYQRTAPGFEAGYTATDVQVGREHKNQATAAQLLSDIQVAIAYLHMLPTVQPGPMGAIGFCFGGHVAYLAATLPEIQATASFYGAGITTMTPGGGAPTLSRTAEIKGTLYAFFGDQDASIPPEQVDQIAQELQRCGVKHRIFRYPAQHGFFCDRRDSYQPVAAADAWTQVQQLFSTTLTG